MRSHDKKRGGFLFNPCVGEEKFIRIEQTFTNRLSAKFKSNYLLQFIGTPEEVSVVTDLFFPGIFKEVRESSPIICE